MPFHSYFCLLMKIIYPATQWVLWAQNKSQGKQVHNSCEVLTSQTNPPDLRPSWVSFNYRIVVLK